MADIARPAPQPKDVTYYVGYFNTVVEISNDMGMGYVTLSPDNQKTLQQLLYDYKILQDRRNIKNVGENLGRRSSDRVKLKLVE